MKNPLKGIARFFRRKVSATTRIIIQNTGGAVVWTPQDYENFAKESYLKNVISYRCIDIISKSVASVPWVIKKKMANGETRDFPDHPLVALLHRPNPDTSWASLMVQTICYILLSGNNFYERITTETGGEKGRIKEIYALRPDRMRILTDQVRGIVTGYQYTVGSREVNWKRDNITGECDILHIKSFHPTDDFWGASVTEPASKEIDTANEATRWNKKVLENEGRPGLVFTVGGFLTDEQYDRLEKQLKEEHGGADNARKNLIVEGEKATVVPYGWNPSELDFLEGSRELNRRIAFAYGVPPMLVGIPGDNTFCLPYHSQIMTERGNVSIGEIKEGDKVFSFNTEGKIQLKEVLLQRKTGTKRLYRIETKNREIEATENHPILVRREFIDENKEKDYYLEYVPVRNLVEGDVLVQVKNLPEIVKEDKVQEEEAELLGFILGDGYITHCVKISDGKGYKRGGRVNLAIPEGTSYGNHYISLLEKYTENKAIRNDRCVSCAGNKYIERLISLGIEGNAHTKRLPQWVFESKKVIRLAFLRGIIDSDGSIDKNGRMSITLCNKELIQDLWHLCISCGLQVKKRVYRYICTRLPNGKEKYCHCYSFMISRAEDVLLIGTYTEKYHSRIKNNLGKIKKGGLLSTGGNQSEERILGLMDYQYVQYSKVKGIFPLFDEDVYDIEVKDNHNFIAEGILVHNSNYKEARMAFWEDTIIFFLNLLKEEFSNWLFPKGSAYFIDYDLNNIPALAPKREKVWEMLERADFLRLNEKRKMVGFEEDREGDVLLVPSNMMPVETADVMSDTAQELRRTERENQQDEQQNQQQEQSQEGQEKPTTIHSVEGLKEIDLSQDSIDSCDCMSEEEKPYANEFACRLKDPSQYDRFTRKNNAGKVDGKRIDFIYGIKGTKVEIQAIRYPKKSWTRQTARKHCQSHKPILFE